MFEYTTERLDNRVINYDMPTGFRYMPDLLYISSINDKDIYSNSFIIDYGRMNSKEYYHENVLFTMCDSDAHFIPQCLKKNDTNTMSFSNFDKIL